MRNFTEEQNMFRDSYRRFLETEVTPHMSRFRDQGIVDREIFQKAGEQRNWRNHISGCHDRTGRWV